MRYTLKAQMNQHPNRLRDSPKGEPEPAPSRRTVSFLTQEQYLVLEKKFPIDDRKDPSFQLGIQAVLKALRDGIVTGA